MGTAVDDQAAVGDVQDPVFWDFGAGVEGGFWVEVEGEGSVGDFSDEADFVCVRNRREFVEGLGEDHRVGVWLAIRWQMDRHVLADGILWEDLTQPLDQQHDADHPPMTLGSFLDALPVNQFVFLWPSDI